jgi:hypothetical protein
MKWAYLKYLEHRLPKADAFTPNNAVHDVAVGCEVE